MIDAYEIWYHAANSPDGRIAFSTALQAGHHVIADAFDPREGRCACAEWMAFIQGREGSSPTRYGVRLACEDAAELMATSGDCPGLGRIVLVGASLPEDARDALPSLRREGIEIYWEYALGITCPVESTWLDGIVVRGYETGGVSQSSSVRTFFSAARSEYPSLRLVVQGIECSEMAAVFLLLGATTLLLDAGDLIGGVSQSREASLDEPVYRPTRFVRDPIDDWWSHVGYVADPSSPEDVLPVGPGVLTRHAKPAHGPESHATVFREDVDLAVSRLLDTTEASLSQSCATPTIIQGPMAMISTSVDFASALNHENVFPVFAFTGLQEAAIAHLAKEVLDRDDLGAFGVGIAGPLEMPAKAIQDCFDGAAPSVVLLSGDHWAERLVWKESTSGDVWLHVQHPAMVEQAWGEGFRHFVFEGCESGGHVGLLPATVLWPLALRSTASLGGNTDDLHCVLAGGIHDAESILFGLLLARACGVGGQLSFMTGTRLLLTDEAVSSGALDASYQQALAQCDLTRVIGKHGLGVRTAVQGDAPVPTNGTLPAVYEAYGNALKGQPSALWLTGECVAHCGSPTSLHDLTAALLSYAERWRKIRSDALAIRRTVSVAQDAHQAVDLAIVGVGGIFPGAANVETFWDNLQSNRRNIQEVPAAHWGPGSYRCPVDEESGRGDTSYAWHAGMITDFTFDHFDCLKFHISPKAAEVTDRIHLMLLKATEEARVSAGVDFQFPSDGTIVVIGNSMGGELSKVGTLRAHIPDILESIRHTPEFQEMDEDSGERLLAELSETLSQRTPAITEDSLVGSAASTLAGRLSGYLKVFGGNMTVDAACASSLAAVTVASEMLQSGRCSCAVVGGVDSDLTIDTFASFCRLKALSATVSRPFMEGSDGFTMGEGGGVAILKRFEDALRDGDTIYARIAGCGMSSDGESGSLTIPSPMGQRRALARAFAESGFRPESIGYVEAHGTGTPVGDAIELQELSRAFETAVPHSIPIGTVKSHIGHLKSAAGIAAIIKVVEALRCKTIPPAWIEGTVRADIRDGASPFVLPPESYPWRGSATLPRRAAISAFGFGGSNYHLHLEEFDERQRQLSTSRLLLFSGNDVDDVRERVAAFSRAVRACGYLHSAIPEQMQQLGGAGECRLAVVWRHDASEWSTVEQDIHAALSGDSVDGIWFRQRCSREKIAFLFPGQGSVGGSSFQQLRDTVPDFVGSIHTSGTHVDLDFGPLLWPGERSESAAADWRKDPRLQPATTALSLALAEMLRAVGVVPDAVAGHSLGFYAALVASGALCEEDALRLLRERALCFDALEQDDMGTMLALRSDAAAVEALIADCPVPCHLANLNSPNQTAVSLSGDDVPAAVEFFTAAGVESQRLSVICGFHSPFVAEAGASFEKHLLSATFHEPLRALYSETLGSRVEADAFSKGCPDWFARHIVQPVRFVELLNAMHADGHRCFVEVGARGTLSRFTQDTLPEDVDCYPVDTARDDVVHHWHELLARLYVEKGAPIDFGAYTRLFSHHLGSVRTGSGSRPTADSDIGLDSQSGPDAPGIGSAARALPQGEDEIYCRIRAILSQFSGFEEALIQPDHEVQGTLGIDSLKTIEIGMEIERQLGVRLTGASFSGALTVQRLAEEVRCSAVGTAPVRAEISRYIPGAVHVMPPLAPDAPARCVAKDCCAVSVAKSKAPDAPARCVAMVSCDEQLVSCWQAAGYGPAYAISDAAALPDDLHAALGADELDGIVYAASGLGQELASDGMQDKLLPAYELAQRQLTREGRDAARGAFRFVTASFARLARPEDDGISAFSKSLQRDLPHVHCGHISFCDDITPDVAAETLHAEASGAGTPYAFVMYHGSKRWVTEFAEQPSEESGEAFALTSTDVILATGGGRGITARVVLALSETMKPSWIVVGSTDLETDSDSARETRGTLHALEALGCKVEYLRCDLAEAESVRSMLRELVTRYPAITGVIHGAGILADANIADKSAEDFSRVVAVKSRSARILEAELDLSKIRLWVSMSSVAAITGNAGQTDYAAASQDLVTQTYRLRRGGVSGAQTILWGPWTGTGMVVSEGLEDRFKALGVPLIEAEVGSWLFVEEVGRSKDPVVAFSGDLARFAEARPTVDMTVWSQRCVVGAAVSMRSRRFSRQEPFLADHVINGLPVLPGVMTLELSAHAFAAMDYPLCWSGIQLERLVTAGDNGLVLNLDWRPVAPQAVAFGCSDVSDASAPASRGTLTWGAALREETRPVADGVVLKTFQRDALYGEQGVMFSGPLFQVIDSALDVGDCWARARLRDRRNLPADGYGSLPTRTPATLVDGLLQIAAIYCLHHLESPYLPSAITELWCSEDSVTDKPVDALVRCTDDTASGNVVQFDAELLVEGVPVMIARGVTLSRIG
jgi:acyl transferase domain-containing protein/NAD(P)-dependent dehydrogenase (short-subunit alcohol dehydrogenase family)/acyl carrier protein/NAD(P)H-dependent flavin oxidoreductase YrpB (nitropropane dioxygenase family)